MLVLALDTCGAESTLVLGELGRSVAILREQTLAPRTAAHAITRAMRAVLGDIAPSALGAIVAVRGPGSFTGMRIGLSAAKALSEAASVPILGVSRLLVLAQQSGCDHVALDAGRGSVYLRSPLLGAEPEQRLEVARVQALPLTGLAICEDRLTGFFAQAERVPPPDARAALRCARERVLAGSWDDAATLDALYLWPVDQMLTRTQPQTFVETEPAR